MTARLTADDMLADAFEALTNLGCQFWACKGPDVPPQSMETCHRCWQVRRLRAFYERQGQPVCDHCGRLESQCQPFCGRVIDLSLAERRTA